MRGKLKALTSDERHLFQATVGRFGTKKGYWGEPVPTVLLLDIKHNGKPKCDHLWLTVGKRIAALDLHEGDVVSFEARVGTYVKGYWGEREIDYTLKNPTKMKKIEAA